MKKALTIGMVGVALATTLSLVGAGSFKREPGPDARTADEIVAATPARAPIETYAAAYTGVARIIHIPQDGERDERASVNNRDEPEATGSDDEEPIAPPPRRRAKPRWPPRSDTPSPPSGPRRAVLSAPPPPAEGPTPIRPTPRFSSKIDQADKIGPPDNTAVTPDVSPSPVDDTLPADLPRGN
jgi:hypothetical protein